jgi:hypothetical protein
MDDFFTFVAMEFHARSLQIRQLLKVHGPSIGTGHEVLLRAFLRDYLPKMFSVGHGFVRKADGEISAQCDLLIYNSTQYAPLYVIDDSLYFSVAAAIEIKSSVTRDAFWMLRKRGRQNLDRNLAAELGVFGSIHLSHSARTDRSKYFVRTEFFAGRDRHLFVRAKLADQTALGPVLRPSRRCDATLTSPR